MDFFTPDLYFNLSTFKHADIFATAEPVWKVLSKIHDYLMEQALGNIEGSIETGAHLVNPELISIGKGTRVEAGAYIIGPCVIGENCQIRHGAYVRGDVLVGDQCVIGHATEAKNAIFMNKSQAGHFAYVGDSVLGNGVNLGAGTKCANLRFDRKPVLVGKERTDSGLKKFGAIFADGSQTGCNTVTNPGTIMEKKSFTLACASVQGVIRAREI